MTALAESAVTLLVASPDLDPAEVSRQLGQAADRAARRGATEVFPGGGRQRAPGGYWQLRAAPRRPADLDAQVAELLGALTPDLAAWRALAGRHALALTCQLFLDVPQMQFGLAPATLAALGARGIAIALEVYGPYTPAGSCGG